MASDQRGGYRSNREFINLKIFETLNEDAMYSVTFSEPNLVNSNKCNVRPTTLALCIGSLLSCKCCYGELSERHNYISFIYVSGTRVWLNKRRTIVRPFFQSHFLSPSLYYGHRFGYRSRA